jgi:hypothetical protein
MMKTLISAVLILFMASPVMANQSREKKQVELDAVCETARLEKLTPMREGFVEECVTNKEKSSREHCERFYADYGNRMGGRAPLFYDLPACVTAFEYAKSSRSSG